MRVKEFIIKNKEHIIVVTVLLILLLSIHHGYVNTNKTMMGDYCAGSLDMFHFMKDTILKYRQFPHWYPTVQGGTIFWGHPNFNVIYYTTLIALLSPNQEFAMNFSQLFNAFLAGLFMYYVMLKLKLKPKFAFVSAVGYMFSLFMNWMIFSNYFRIPVGTWLPLVFYFTWKAIHSRDWLKYSIISGIMLTTLFLSGGLNIAFFVILVFVVIVPVCLIGKNFFKRFIKTSMVHVVILLVFFGLFSIKLFPMLEYDKYIVTKSGTTFDQGVGRPLEIKLNSFEGFIYSFILPKKDSGTSQNLAKVGITGLLLIMFSFYKIKKRHVLFFFILSILAILVATGSPVYYVFWKFVPGFNKLHHVYRASLIFIFAAAALYGIGFSVIYEKIKKRFRFSKKAMKRLYLVILSLILIDILVITVYDKYDWVDFQKMLEENNLMQYLKEDKDIFRINNIKTKNHAGFGGQYSTYLDLEILYGGYSMWYPEFYVYLGLAHSYPAKLYGMLNTKYIYSNEPINVSGLRFFKKFPECEICAEDGNTDVGIDGPYLYLNEMYVPRAYLIDYSILVVGDENAVEQNAYGIMINDNFNSANTVVVIGEKGKVSNYDIDFLKRFNVVLLTQGSVDENSGFILKQYVDSGGILIPNIVEGVSAISTDDLNNILSSFKGDYSDIKKVNINLYSPNKRVMDLEGYKGFLVTAEKYFLFEGWKAKLNSEKKEILRANGMNSAVYLNGEDGEITFEYKPKSFRKGLIISSLTLILIILYFSYRFWKRKKKKEKSPH